MCGVMCVCVLSFFKSSSLSLFMCNALVQQYKHLRKMHLQGVNQMLYLKDGPLESHLLG